MTVRSMALHGRSAHRVGSRHGAWDGHRDGGGLWVFIVTGAAPPPLPVIVVKFQKVRKVPQEFDLLRESASDPHGLNRVLVSLIDRLQRQMLYRVLV